MQKSNNFSYHCDSNGFFSAWIINSNTVFHKLDEIGSNADIGIKGMTMWKQNV